MLAGIEGEATRPRLQLRSRRLPPARRISDATPETLTATPTDTNDVRKATDAGEHPLMDSYIRIFRVECGGRHLGLLR